MAGSTHVLGRGLRPTAIWLPNMVLTDRFELELPFGSAAGDYVLKVGFVDSPMSSVGPFNLEASGAKQIFVSRCGEVRRMETGALGRAPDVGSSRDPAGGFGRIGSGTRHQIAGHVLVEIGGRRIWDLRSCHTIDRRTGRDSKGDHRYDRFFLWGDAGEPGHNSPVAGQSSAGTTPDRVLVSDGAGNMLSISSEKDVASLAKSVLLWVHYVPGGETVVDLDMDDGLRILGYERELADDTVDVTVYWQARDKIKRQYTSFIHLLDREGRLVDQHDAVAYYGGMPTTRWEVGRAVPFAAKLRLPESGGPFRLRSGMYEFNSRVRLATADGRAYISLGLLEGRERPEGPAVEFAGGVRLLGYRMERENDQGLVTLYWQTSRRVGHNYSVYRARARFGEQHSSARGWTAGDGGANHRGVAAGRGDSGPALVRDAGRAPVAGAGWPLSSG